MKKAIEATEKEIDTDQKKLKAARIVSTDSQHMAVSPDIYPPKSVCLSNI